jgi:hypothetical protein
VVIFTLTKEDGCNAFVLNVALFSVLLSDIIKHIVFNSFSFNLTGIETYKMCSKLFPGFNNKLIIILVLQLHKLTVKYNIKL